MEIGEKGENVVRKEKENSLVRDSGLNNKIIKMAANGMKAEQNQFVSFKCKWRQNGMKAEQNQIVSFGCKGRRKWKPKKMNMMDIVADTINANTIGEIM